MNNEKKQLTVKKGETFSLSNPSELINFASTLKEHIKDQKLFSNIQGRSYVNVEGWQFAGGFMGLIPIVKSLEDLSNDNEIKYRCEVDIINLKTNELAGRGIAICSNKEPTKKNFAEFAIASMAQTRAIGKGYRNLLAWIIKSAGYEATPAEEMDYETKAEEVRPESKQSKPVKKEAPKSPPPPKQEEDVKMATVNQKTQILLLVNNKAITTEEKNKMIEGLNKLDFERANKAIAKLKKVIEEREGKDTTDIDKLGERLKAVQKHPLFDDDMDFTIDDQIRVGGRTKSNLETIIGWAEHELVKREKASIAGKEVQHG